MIVVAEEHREIGLSEAGHASDYIGGLRMEDHQPPSWHEMWERVQRGYGDLKATYGGRPDVPISQSSETFKDSAYDLFRNLFHMKDWIKNDATVPVVVRESVEGYVSAHPDSLELCRSIAHTDKHHTRNPGKRSARITVVDVNVVVGRGTRAKYIIRCVEPDGHSSSRDALELATQALIDWQQFLKTNNLR